MKLQNFMNYNIFIILYFTTVVAFVQSLLNVSFRLLIIINFFLGVMEFLLIWNSFGT